jgi:hypothetical protein
MAKTSSAKTKVAMKQKGNTKQKVVKKPRPATTTKAPKASKHYPKATVEDSEDEDEEMSLIVMVTPSWRPLRLKREVLKTL